MFKNKIKDLHDMVKENYENGTYSRDYSYHGPYAHNDEKGDNISDFERGRDKYRQDKSNGHIRIWYYAPFIKILNKIVDGRMQEIVDFLNGYRYEKLSNK
ncbi:hypothetical protein [Fructobacillus fructosus]|uniref:hypothetical protein n=1 Tax=Fructobacillus fructosus TaxID=1631 RepID=UPI001658BAFD|nr:hypothetical protein [Fructobacillus fructosus]MBC9119433.1 hypothetical protein [Fructobacillus fructosus]MBD9367026.1 hypothetical protein [Leuconostoc mesenteroides]